MTEHRKGILYCIGVGPGEPELMTLKAARMIKECQVAAIPHVDRAQCVAYQIAVQAVPELEEKELLCLDMPMTKDKDLLARSQGTAAGRLVEQLEPGRDVALVTGGGFCAVAARLNIPLVKNSEELHILPASYQIEEGLKLPGVKVLMKAGRKLSQVKQLLAQGNYQVTMVENCGMPGERVYRTVEEIPEDAGYFSLLIVRDL